MDPRPGGGQGIAVGMSGALIKVLPQQWVGGYPGFAFNICKKGSEMKR